MPPARPDILYRAEGLRILTIQLEMKSRWVWNSKSGEPKHKVANTIYLDHIVCGSRFQSP